MATKTEWAIIAGVVGIALVACGAADNNGWQAERERRAALPRSPLVLVSYGGDDWHLYRDQDTGCEYYGYYQGGLEPRLGRDGKQICRSGQ